MQPITETTTSKLSSGDRQRLGVALEALDVDAGLAGQPPAFLEQLGGEVDADDAPARLRRADRRVAGAAGDVEHVLAGRDPDAATIRSPSGHSCRWAIAG